MSSLRIPDFKSGSIKTVLHSWALEKACRRWAWLHGENPNDVLFVQLPLEARAAIVEAAEAIQLTEQDRF